MVHVSEVGSLCDIQIRGKFPLFSEINFDKLLQEAGYERRVDTNNNDQPYYVKDEIIIFNDFVQNTITLKLRNIISFQPQYDEFVALLVRLGYKPESAAVMGGHFRTFVTDMNTPIFLDKLLNEKAKTLLSTKLDITPNILTVTLVNSDPTIEDLQIRLEPLNSSPNDSMYIDVIYRTAKHDNFNEFINKFDADFIKELVNTISGAK